MLRLVIESIPHFRQTIELDHHPAVDRSRVALYLLVEHIEEVLEVGSAGNQIRVRSKAEQTFLIQLCNGAEGYLPTVKAEKGGHYSAFISSGECGHEGGELYVRETLQEIQELFPEVE